MSFAAVAKVARLETTSRNRSCFGSPFISTRKRASVARRSAFSERRRRSAQKTRFVLRLRGFVKGALSRGSVRSKTAQSNGPFTRFIWIPQLMHLLQPLNLLQPLKYLNS